MIIKRGEGRVCWEWLLYDIGGILRMVACTSIWCCGRWGGGLRGGVSCYIGDLMNLLWGV